MAHTQVNETCIVCGEKIEIDAVCFYLDKVKAVKYGIRQGNIFYNSGDIVPVKEGKLRIKHLNSKKGLIHLLCWEKMRLWEKIRLKNLEDNEK